MNDIDDINAAEGKIKVSFRRKDDCTTKVEYQWS